MNAKASSGELKTFEDKGFDEGSAAAVWRVTSQQWIALRPRPVRQSGR